MAAGARLTSRLTSYAPLTASTEKTRTTPQTMLGLGSYGRRAAFPARLGGPQLFDHHGGGPGVVQCPTPPMLEGSSHALSVVGVLGECIDDHHAERDNYNR